MTANEIHMPIDHLRSFDASDRDMFSDQTLLL